MKTTALTCVAAVLPVVIGLSSSFAATAAGELSFDQFPAKIYKGRTQLPKFKTRDKNFREYRTMIREALKAGPSFAGEFSVVEFGCGMPCTVVFIASNRTGEVFEFPESYGPVNLLYQVDSRLIVVQVGSPVLPSFSCELEWYVWSGRRAKLLKTETIGLGDICGNPVSENIQTQSGKTADRKYPVPNEAGKTNKLRDAP